MSSSSCWTVFASSTFPGGAESDGVLGVLGSAGLDEWDLDDSTAIENGQTF